MQTNTIQTATIIAFPTNAALAHLRHMRRMEAEAREFSPALDSDSWYHAEALKEVPRSPTR